MNPTELQIKEAVNNSGYLFEQQIGYELKKVGYLVTPNYNFEDIDTGESREIDLHAIIGHISKDEDVFIEQLLLIECKKTSNSMVFFSKPEYERIRFLNEYFEIVGAPESINAGDDKGVLGIERYLSFSNLSHRFKIRDTSSQFCMIMPKGKIWEAKHEHIYNGMIVPLIKCLSHERKDYRSTISKDFIQLRIIYPIVIVDSFLYMMNSETNELKKKKWILFYRDYESKNVKITSKIDFVRHKFLSEYLKNIKISFDEIASKIIANRKILQKKIDTKQFYMED